jgi:hypothetical protein
MIVSADDVGTSSPGVALLTDELRRLLPAVFASMNGYSPSIVYFDRHRRDSRRADLYCDFYRITLALDHKLS